MSYELTCSLDRAIDTLQRIKPSRKPLQMSAQEPSPSPTTFPAQPAKVALQSTAEVTPTGTLNITLVPAPTTKIPFFENPTAWVPIVTLLGVIITIVAGWKKTKMELKFAAQQATIERDQSREQANLERQHHSEQAHQERITKARREVYLEVVSEMVKAQSTLGLLPTKDIEKLEVEASLNGLIAAVSKVSIFGEMETVEMSRELLTTIHQSLFRMLALIVPYHEDKWEADNQLQKVANQILEINRLAAEIQAVRETSNDEEELQRLHKTLKFRNADMERHGAASLDANKAVMRRQKAYGDAALAETIAISQKVDELIVRIRAELSLSTSLEKLRASSAAMHAAAVTATEELRSTVNNDDEAVSH